MKMLIAGFLSYFIGNISGAFILGKWGMHIDIRDYGSGNSGTTNAFRVMGKKYGVLTFIIDFFKGVLCCLIISKYFGRDYVPLSIFCCVIGHDYPIFMNFKGGKGVATTLGAFACFNLPFTLIPLLAWVMSTVLTKMVSVGSIVFFLVLGIVFSFFASLDGQSIIWVVAVCLLGVYRHHSNIKRIIRGTENKIGGKK